MKILSFLALALLSITPVMASGSSEGKILENFNSQSIKDFYRNLLTKHTKEIEKNGEKYRVFKEDFKDFPTKKDYGDFQQEQGLAKNYLSSLEEQLINTESLLLTDFLDETALFLVKLDSLPDWLARSLFFLKNIQPKEEIKDSLNIIFQQMSHFCHQLYEGNYYGFKEASIEFLRKAIEPSDLKSALTLLEYLLNDLKTSAHFNEIESYEPIFQDIQYCLRTIQNSEETQFKDQMNSLISQAKFLDEKPQYCLRQKDFNNLWPFYRHLQSLKESDLKKFLPETYLPADYYNCADSLVSYFLTQPFPNKLSTLEKIEAEVKDLLKATKWKKEDQRMIKINKKFGDLLFRWATKILNLFEVSKKDQYDSTQYEEIKKYFKKASSFLDQAKDLGFIKEELEEDLKKQRKALVDALKCLDDKHMKDDVPNPSTASEISTTKKKKKKKKTQDLKDNQAPNTPPQNPELSYEEFQKELTTALGNKQGWRALLDRHWDRFSSNEDFGSLLNSLYQNYPGHEDLLQHVVSAFKKHGKLKEIVDLLSQQQNLTPDLWLAFYDAHCALGQPLESFLTQSFKEAFEEAPSIPPLLFGPWTFCFQEKETLAMVENFSKMYKEGLTSVEITWGNLKITRIDVKNFDSKNFYTSLLPMAKDKKYNDVALLCYQQLGLFLEGQLLKFQLKQPIQKISFGEYLQESQGKKLNSQLNKAYLLKQFHLSRKEDPKNAVLFAQAFKQQEGQDQDELVDMFLEKWELTNALAKEQKNNDKLLEDLNKVKSENGDLKARNQELTQNQKKSPQKDPKLTQTIEDQNVIISKKDEEILGLKAELKKTQKEENTQDETINSLNKELTQIKNALEEASKNLKATQEEALKNTNVIAEKNKKIKDLEKQFAQLKTENAQLKAELEKAQKEKKATVSQKTIAEKDKTIEDLNQKIEALKVGFEASQRNLESLKANNLGKEQFFTGKEQEYQKEILEQKRTIEALNKELKTNEKSYEERSDLWLQKVENSEIRINFFKKEIEDLKKMQNENTTIKALNDKVVEQGKWICKLLDEKNGCEKKTDRLNKELTKCRIELSMLLEKYKNSDPQQQK